MEPPFQGPMILCSQLSLSGLHDSINTCVLIGIGHRLLWGGGVYRNVDPWFRLYTAGPRWFPGRAGSGQSMWPRFEPLLISDTLVRTVRSIPPQEFCTCCSWHEPSVFIFHCVAWLIPFCHLGSQPKCPSSVRLSQMTQSRVMSYPLTGPL